MESLRAISGSFRDPSGRVYVAGDRRDHFEAQTELKQLVAGFMKGEVEPHLESGAQRLESLREQVAQEDSVHADFYRERVCKLSIWRRGLEASRGKSRRLFCIHTH